MFLCYKADKAFKNQINKLVRMITEARGHSEISILHNNTFYVAYQIKTNTLVLFMYISLTELGEQYAIHTKKL